MSFFFLISFETVLNLRDITILLSAQSTKFVNLLEIFTLIGTCPHFIAYIRKNRHDKAIRLKNEFLQRISRIFTIIGVSLL